jgi:hypothetical protein
LAFSVRATAPASGAGAAVLELRGPVAAQRIDLFVDVRESAPRLAVRGDCGFGAIDSRKPTTCGLILVNLGNGAATISASQTTTTLLSGTGRFSVLLAPPSALGAGEGRAFLVQADSGSSTGPAAGHVDIESSAGNLQIPLTADYGIPVLSGLSSVDCAAPGRQGFLLNCRSYRDVTFQSQTDELFAVVRNTGAVPVTLDLGVELSGIGAVTLFSTTPRPLTLRPGLAVAMSLGVHAALGNAGSYFVNWLLIDDVEVTYPLTQTGGNSL